MSEDAIKIFYSYSRKDLDLRNTLEDHLSALREAGRISTWHDLELEAGTEWEPAILNKLDTADIILLLISSSFIASKYCYGTELKRAIARHDAGTARVIPIILRPCDWNHSYVPFSKLNVLPTHAKPITSWTDRDEAFAIVAQQIRETVDHLKAKKLAERQAEERWGQQLLAQREAERQKEAERLVKRERILREQRRQREVVEKRREEKQQRKQQEAEVAERQKHELEQQWVSEQQRRESERGKQAAQPVSVNELASEREVDYRRLRDLLKAGQWKEADQETADRMCEVMGRPKEGWLRVEDMQNFPCTDLHTLDQLWVKHSRGRFGFSVQKKIWQECGSPTEYNSNWERFGEAVGWKKKGFLGMNKDWVLYNEVTFDTSVAPKGHLPVLVIPAVLVGGGRDVRFLLFLLSRRDL